MLLDISRHKEMFDPRTFELPIHIIGVGSTGSWLALCLAKLGIPGRQIMIWDFDKIEEHNIANQFYSPLNDINKLKVERLQYNIHNMTGNYVDLIPAKYETQRLSGIVFLMVDSMAERKKIWEGSIRGKSAIQLLVEPRLGLDVGRVYNVEPTNPTHIKRYEDTYYSDEGAEISACGNSMTVITSAMCVATWCCRQLINYHNDVEVDNEILIDFKYNNIITERWI